nr:unnamed protein product [Callosobruchus chinensis]
MCQETLKKKVQARCPQCGKTYKNYSTLRVHLKLDCGIDKKHVCPVCGKCFRRRSNMIKHMKRDYVHMAKMNFLDGNNCSILDAVSCPKCHKVYKNLNTMSAHLYQDCGKEKKFMCGYCPKVFKRRHQVQVHIARRHPAFIADSTIYNIDHPAFT